MANYNLILLMIGLIFLSVEIYGNNDKVMLKERETMKHESAHSTFCSRTHPKTKYSQTYHTHLYTNNYSRKKRSIDKTKPNKALRFMGNEGGLQMNDEIDVQYRNKTQIPRNLFTVQLWMKPEGGQTNPTTILRVSDLCAEENVRSGWEIGIKAFENNHEKGLRIYSSLKTEMAKTSSVLWTPSTYIPNKWIKISITYDNNRFTMYLDGARVDMTHQQIGPIFSELRSKCKHIILGGKASISHKSIGYRGLVDHILILDRALNASLIAFGSNQLYSNPVLMETFETLNQWTLIGGSLLPTIVSCDRDSGSNVHITVPPCGQTVCDHPDVITSYANNLELRNMKNLKYRLVNIVEPHATNSWISPQQIRKQHTALNRVFNQYNISWTMELIELQSRPLRRKTILFGCDSAKIGNGRCDFECRHTITGNDGGDCDTKATDCTQTLLHNGECDVVCNRPEHDWDKGQCCNASKTDVHETCIDPKSPLRSYIGIDEYKKILNFTNEDALTIAFARWNNDELIGLSTFPWEKEVNTIYGGIVLQPERFGVDGHKDNLIHEIGHALGLWHVHHGVSEVACDDECREFEPSLTTGDLVADTSPTPKNMQCQDPMPGAGVCGDATTVYKNTPFSNFMSYADEDCTDHFTPNQVARIHCYIDLKYRGWMINNHNKAPILDNVIPLAPRVVKTAINPKPSITLGWMAPLGFEACRPGTKLKQAECSLDGRLVQYASKASSPGPYKLSGYWAPHQATGQSHALQSSIES